MKEQRFEVTKNFSSIKHGAAYLKEDGKIVVWTDAETYYHYNDIRKMRNDGWLKELNEEENESEFIHVGEIRNSNTGEIIKFKSWARMQFFLNDCGFEGGLLAMMVYYRKEVMNLGKFSMNFPGYQIILY